MAKKTQSPTAKSTANKEKLNKPMPQKCIKQYEKIQKGETQIGKILRNLK